MEKEKKVVKKPAKPAKAEKVVDKKVKAEKKPVKKVEAVKPVKVQAAEVVAPKAEVKDTAPAAPKKAVTLNQELNLMIGLFSILTIITFCFAFESASVDLLGWEIFLKADAYSGVLKGLMVFYVISLVIDCILAVRIDTESEIVNIVEKVLYMFTFVISFIVGAVFLSIIGKVGFGLIIFLVLSIVSGIMKLVRIYAQHK